VKSFIDGKTMQQPLPLIRNTPDSTWERIYWYFVQAEENREILTSVKIQQVFLTDTGEIRELDTVRWYMYHYWRWFLFCVNDQVKPYQYRCNGIKSYPIDYFVQAHTIPNRTQYLAHFVRSIEKDKEVRRQAVGRGQPRKPRSDASAQLPLDEIIGDQVPDEIAVDGHEEEEGPIQESPEIQTSGEEELVSPTPHDVMEPSEREGGLPEPEPASSPPQSKRFPPILIAGVIVIVCVAVAAAYLFLARQPR
jgi:hypothetical protein